MAIRFYPTTDIGTLTPEVNAGDGKPFAVIDLGTSGHFSLHDEADLDRLIAAACEAKRMLIAYKSGERHAWQEGSGHYACALCGSLRADAIHDVPKIRYCEVHDTHHDGTGECEPDGLPGDSDDDGGEDSSDYVPVQEPVTAAAAFADEMFGGRS